jgi:hypothetical protein
VCGEKGYIKKDYAKKNVKNVKVHTITITLWKDPVVLKVRLKIGKYYLA